MLQELKLGHLIPNIEREDIDIDVCMGLTEEQISRPGVKAIGEKASRVRSELRETYHELIRQLFWLEGPSYMYLVDSSN